jgi:MFS family permease
MIVAVLPQRVVSLDGSGQSVGYLASAFAFPFILLQIPIGILSDKLGFKPFLIIGYLLCFLAGLMYFLATSSCLIFSARFLQGIGEAPVWALAPALLSVKFPMNKGKVMGIYNAIFHMGLTLGPVLGIALAKALNGNEIFLVYSFCSLAGAVVISLLVEPITKKESKTKSFLDFQNIFKLIRQRQTSITLIGITLYGTGYGIFHTTIPAFLLQKKSLTAVEIGVFFSLFYVAISLSQIISGPLSDRFGRNIFMIIGLLVATCGITFTPFLSMPLILLALTVASLGMGVFYLTSMSFLNEIVPNYLKGTISGAYYLFWGIGMFFGPPIMTQIATYTSFQASMTGYSLLILLVAIGLMNSGCKAKIK